MGIIVEWKGRLGKETEYIDDIDLDNLEDGYEERVQMQTKSWWPGIGEFVKYEVDVWVERPPTDDHIVLVVEYDRGRNVEFPHQMFFGTNRIIIEQGQDHGNYQWIHEHGEIYHSENYNSGWKKEELREPRDHRRSHQQIRDEQFRHQIISLDKKCVISGETTRAALDAAHIIPAAEDGNEIRRNGIALRADIHRLYDAKMFFIDPKSGKPVIDNESIDQLSDDQSFETYRNLLDASEGLPSETLKRVSEALREVRRGR